MTQSKKPKSFYLYLLMVGLMLWAQISSAGQICQLAQMQIDNHLSQSMPVDSETESEDTTGFFLRGPIEEEIHHPPAFLYRPNLNVIMILSFPRHNDIFAQVQIFEQIKPPCYS